MSKDHGVVFFLICLGLYLCRECSKISGACFNPAVAFCFGMFKAIDKKDSKEIG